MNQVENDSIVDMILVNYNYKYMQTEHQRKERLFTSGRPPPGLSDPHTTLHRCLNMLTPRSCPLLRSRPSQSAPASSRHYIWRGRSDGCDADNKEGTQRPELTKDEPPKLEYTDTKGGAGDSAAAERPAGHRSDADAGLRCLARRFTVLHPLASADALAQSSVCWSLRRVVCLRVQCSRKEITENGKFSTRSIGSRNTFHPRRLK